VTEIVGASCGEPAYMFKSINYNCAALMLSTVLLEFHHKPITQYWPVVFSHSSVTWKQV